MNAAQEVIFSKSTKANRLTIPTKRIPEGMYFLQVVYPDGVAQEHIIISHE